VIDRDLTPTAAMLQSDLAPPDLPALEAAITERVGAERVAFVDSTRLAEGIFANHLLANVVLLGAAFQLGGLPLALADVERAMQRQGKAAADNLAAFEWGRWAVHDPAAVQAVLAAVEGGQDGVGSIFDPSPSAVVAAAHLVDQRPLPAALRDLLVRRAAQAIDYQSAARAERFLDLVGRAAAADDAARGWALTRAVAEAWFKLLTYKDEYEVARLHLEVDYDEVAAELGIEGPYAVTYHLHPPILRRLGLKKKLPLGKPYALAFQALARMKRLRGTPLDVFGWDPDRRLERAVVEEYEQLLDAAVRPGSTLPYDVQVRLAESALEVKGYGPIKETAVAAWREHVAELRRTVPTGTGG
jgi:indolepyruvate ferredoxin oxidoreductase